MTPLVNDATSWVVNKIAQYPQQIAKNSIRQITNLAIDAVLPKNETSKFLKEIAPDLVMIIGEGLYKAVTCAKTAEEAKNNEKTQEKIAKGATTKESLQPSISRGTLKKMVKVIHDAL